MNKRPILITLLCILITLGTLGILYGFFTGGFPPAGETVPEWFKVSTGLLSVSYLAAIALLWKMQKRGAELYIATTIVGDTLGVIAGFGTLDAFLVPIIFIAIMLFYYKRMSGPSLLPSKRK
ncbi:MAG TPA: hypothetical protein VGE62_01625 [Candidatus Paceibacterota bacterium]